MFKNYCQEDYPLLSHDRLYNNLQSKNNVFEMCSYHVMDINKTPLYWANIIKLIYQVHYDHK